MRLIFNTVYWSIYNKQSSANKLQEDDTQSGNSLMHTKMPHCYVRIPDYSIEYLDAYVYINNGIVQILGTYL